MQIRLTVVDPQGPTSPTPGSSRAEGLSPARGRAASCDVLVTAPAGTALAAVASALASAVSGDPGAAQPERGRESGGQVVLYAGAERLDGGRCTLGEPPLIDGAVLSLGAPAEPEPHPEVDDAPTRLHVVAGPDAGGVHLLHGGQIHLGRSADADVPLDDPDVSRLHCAVTVAADGRVSVADLDSTNGTTLDGTRVGTRPVRFAPGALLRIGESALRLTPAGGPGARMPTTPDGEGQVRVPAGSGTADGGHAGTHAHLGDPGDPGDTGDAAARARDAVGAGSGTPGPTGPTRHTYGSAGWAASHVEQAAQGQGRAEPPGVPEQGGAPRIESAGPPSDDVREQGPYGGRAVLPRQNSGGDTHAGASGALGAPAGHTRPGHPDARPRGGPSADAASDEDAFAGQSGKRDGQRGGERGGPRDGARDPEHGGRRGEQRGGREFEAGDQEAGENGRRKGTPLRGTDVPQGLRRRGGIGAWARRLTGGRGEPEPPGPQVYDEEPAPVAVQPPDPAPQAPETWPDPAALLLTALGPGPRLWEREPGHPEALTVRLGTADRAAPDGSALLPVVPVTADLREAGALGLAGPRTRLTGLARAVVAQLAALHSPDALEVVLISADRARPVAERTADWAWLGWLPHVRPGHGQDCRLLLAYDREQATARTDELLRRLEDHLAETRGGPRPTAAGSRRDSAAEAGDRAGSPHAHSPAHRPAWARDEDTPDGTGTGASFPGPYTVVVVDGDPGGAAVREAVARLALEGPRAGIHVVCLAETAPASPASPVTDTYEAACAASPTFRECGAVALLSGDVATALRLLRVARAGSGTAEPGPVGHGTVAAVDAVSPAWAERFARALAPLRTESAAGERLTRVSAPLPQAARLLDELGLARATPASLMARWADAADDADSLGGRAWAVLGAGPRGPVCADLAAEGPHLLVEGPPGSGRTELLRAVVASLAAAERPDRLSVVLMDGRDSVGGGGGHGEGLRVCTDVPHVTTHLTANDPVRMREFAQSLSAELKRRAELLGRSDFTEWHTGRELSGRMVAQRSAAARAASAGGDQGGDLDVQSSSTLRLRPAAARRQAETAPPLPRLVVVVDDLDALVSPALGSPGRPAAGSVIRALEAVAREGERLGVHLVAATGPGGRTAETEPARRATLRVALDAPAAGPDEPAPGRGRLTWSDGRLTVFQGGRVTGRIPRTATLRPTVVALEWSRMGDPPARRPVRELGNGPTDLALLASALERAAREVSAPEVPSLL
ncbi:FtsK/SpoIIIE domain-containing protein [Streptomyces sp. NPDC005574]|uniref:FtsK/SpoIIIE domain-containing protein n=1 Tax=Streptomyces sp. NPDC005574 TaxID=3156891 RepID=UPI0033B872E2